MKKKTKMVAIICTLVILFTGAIFALADQENEFEYPHEHEYQITAFETKTGIITFTCDICEEEHTENFIGHINERGYDPTDMNHDGIVNGKDFAYLMRNYGNMN